MLGRESGVQSAGAGAGAGAGAEEVMQRSNQGEACWTVCLPKAVNVMVCAWREV